MKWYEKAWNWLSGKKTLAGITLHAGLFIYSVISKDLSIKESLEYHGYISTVTGVGLFHKIGKTKKGKEITKKITDAAKASKQNTKRDKLNNKV